MHMPITMVSHLNHRGIEVQKSAQKNKTDNNFSIYMKHIVILLLSILIAGDIVAQDKISSWTNTMILSKETTLKELSKKLREPVDSIVKYNPYLKRQELGFSNLTKGTLVAFPNNRNLPINKIKVGSICKEGLARCYFFINEGQNWESTAQNLDITKDVIAWFNPSLVMSETALNPCVISIPIRTLYWRGYGHFTKDMQKRFNKETLKHYSQKLISGDLNRTTPMKQVSALETRLKALCSDNHRSYNGQKFYEYKNSRYGTQYYTPYEFSRALDLSIDSLKTLLSKGLALHKYPREDDIICFEDVQRERELLTNWYDNPYFNSCGFSYLYFPEKPDSVHDLLPKIELLQKQIFRKSIDRKMCEIFVGKGQNLKRTASILHLSYDSIAKYNPTITINEVANSDCIINIPLRGYGGDWSSLHDHSTIEILENYATNIRTGAIMKPLPMKERLDFGKHLYCYDLGSIENVNFWSIHDIKQDVTANQISETIGIPLDQLKLYCKDAAEVRGYDAIDQMKSYILCQYFLSKPNMTIEDLAKVSRNNFQGVDHIIHIYIPEDPSKSKLNTNGSVDLPAVIPSKIESAKTLKKFFSNFPSFKCKETGVTLTLASNGECFFAYVDGKLLGKFEVDVNKEYPTKALIGLPWLNGWGPAPMVLSLNGENTTLSLLPVEGEENLSYNSRGYLQHGRTGNKTWMQLSLSSDGISFTPVDYKPNPELFHFTGFPSQKNPDNDNSIIYTQDKVDQKATYFGGQTDLYRFISYSLQYPEEAFRNNIQGKVVLRLLIEQNGEISDISVYKSVHPLLDSEALRVAKTILRFTPAIKNGLPVRSYLYLPISFKCG